MYYSGITLFKETHDFAKINLCFVFSCVQMPTVISVIRLTVLVKGPTKSYYTQYLCMVIVLFNTALCRSAFSMVSFRRLVFLSFCAFFESRHQNLCHHAM